MKISSTDTKEYAAIVSIDNQEVDEKYATADTEHITPESGTE